MENMSQAPFLLSGARRGLRLGNQNLIDSMVHDGLWDPYNNRHMGNCGDLCAREMAFSRKDQDEFAAESFRRAQETQRAGKFRDEIAAVRIPGKSGEVTIVNCDEGPGRVKFEKIPSLKPAFDKNGTVTAANASTINDGAAALVLTTTDRAIRLGVAPLARIVSYAGHSQDPLWFTTAPADAMRKAAANANWEINSIDVFEVNEAFAVVALAAQRDLRLPHAKLNVYGGAIALGHPIGCSGARILVTMLSVLKDRGARRGLAGICIGGGEALAMCLERS
jgi:acetyl-CoA C-acetyltransferase